MSSFSWVPIKPGPVASLIITRCMPRNNILYLLTCISSGQTWSHRSNCSLMLLYYGVTLYVDVYYGFLHILNLILCHTP